MAKKTQQQQARHLAVSDGWAQPNESLADNDDGWRQAKNNWRTEKQDSLQPDGISVPGKSPAADGAIEDVAMGLCSLYTAINREQHHREHLRSVAMLAQKPGHVLEEPPHRMALGMVLWLLGMSSQAGTQGALGNHGGWSQPLFRASRRVLITS